MCKLVQTIVNLEPLVAASRAPMQAAIFSLSSEQSEPDLLSTTWLLLWFSSQRPAKPALAVENYRSIASDSVVSLTSRVLAPDCYLAMGSLE